MTTEAPPPIPVLYFDARGHGPDEVLLQLETIDLRIPGKVANLGLRINPGGITLMIPTGGGFMCDRESIATLSAQLVAWLEQNPALPASADEEITKQ